MVRSSPRPVRGDQARAKWTLALNPFPNGGGLKILVRRRWGLLPQAAGICMFFFFASSPGRSRVCGGWRASEGGGGLGRKSQGEIAAAQTLKQAGESCEGMGHRKRTRWLKVAHWSIPQAILLSCCECVLTGCNSCSRSF